MTDYAPRSPDNMTFVEFAKKLGLLGGPDTRSYTRVGGVGSGQVLPPIAPPQPQTISVNGVWYSVGSIQQLLQDLRASNAENASLKADVAKRGEQAKATSELRAERDRFQHIVQSHQAAYAALERGLERADARIAWLERAIIVASLRVPTEPYSWDDNSQTFPDQGEGPFPAS